MDARLPAYSTTRSALLSHNARQLIAERELLAARLSAIERNYRTEAAKVACAAASRKEAEASQRVPEARGGVAMAAVASAGAGATASIVAASAAAAQHRKECREVEATIAVVLRELCVLEAELVRERTRADAATALLAREVAARENAEARCKVAERRCEAAESLSVESDRAARAAEHSAAAVKEAAELNVASAAAARAEATINAQYAAQQLAELSDTLKTSLEQASASQLAASMREDMSREHRVELQLALAEAAARCELLEGKLAKATAEREDLLARLLAQVRAVIRWHEPMRSSAT